MAPQRVIASIALLGFVLASLAAGGCGQATSSADQAKANKTVAASVKPPAPNNDEPTPNNKASDQQPETRSAVLAGGCFWCVEAVLEHVEGVKQVISGYAGGQASTAKYKQVASGGTEHAESVKIVYDPAEITYGQLLRIFFTTHDPTQLNRQGPDVGRQYRSAVFYANDRQKQIAEQYIEQLNSGKTFDAPVVTTLEKLEAFYPAEAYHQDYVRKNPSDPYVQQYVPAKLQKLRKHFPERFQSEALWMDIK
jgi:peptide-methionine (S)-S-oxide reductase